MKHKTCQCGGKIKQSRCLEDNYLIDCMKCDKCGEVLFTSKQIKDLIKLRQADKEIKGARKIIKVGSSIAAILPKKVENYGIHEGIVDKVRILSSKSLEIQFTKELI